MTSSCTAVIYHRLPVLIRKNYSLPTPIISTDHRQTTDHNAANKLPTLAVGDFRLLSSLSFIAFSFHFLWFVHTFPSNFYCFVHHVYNTIHVCTFQTHSTNLLLYLCVNFIKSFCFTILLQQILSFRRFTKQLFSVNTRIAVN